MVHRRASFVVSLMLALGLLTAALPTPATARPPRQTALPSAYLSIVPVSDIGGPLTGIIADDRYAYVGEGGTTVVLDLNDLSAPEPIGSIAVPLRNAALVDDVLYAVADDLRIIDVSNPQRPQLMSTVATPGAARDVQVIGTLAYIADGTGGLQIVDVSDPAQPQPRGRVDTPGNALGVALTGAQAFVADETSLQRIDVANPDAPVLRATLPLPGAVVDVQARDAWLYVASNRTASSAGAGLLIFNISDPAAPQQRAAYNPANGVSAVQIVGERAYIGAETLDIVNISDPAAPSKLGNYVPSGPFYATTDFVYTITGNYVDIVGVGAAAEPTLIGYYPTIGYAIDVAQVGGFAYVSDIERAFWIVDVRDPARPRVRGALGLPESARDIEVVGGFAYLLAGTELLIVDVRDVTTPEIVGALEIGRDGQQVEIVGDYAYVAAGANGLLVVDVTAPEDPQPLATFATSAPAYGVDVVGNIAYVAAGTAGLLLINVEDAAKPALVGTYPTPGAGGSRDVQVAGALAYVVFEGAGFEVVDVSNPAIPARLNGVATQGRTIELALAGGLAYVLEFDRIEVIDIRDPAQIVVRGQYRRAGSGGGSGAIAVSGSFAYVADTSGGLQVLRVRLFGFRSFFPSVPR